MGVFIFKNKNLKYSEPRILILFLLHSKRRGGQDLGFSLLRIILKINMSRLTVLKGTV
jgi:hypothetical protein